MELSSEIKMKLEKIIDYLKKTSCSKILLFGSFAEGDIHENSDIDIAVSGMNTEDFFNAIAKLPIIIKQKIDIVDFDDLPLRFQKCIEKSGKILYGN